VTFHSPEQTLSLSGCCRRSASPMWPTIHAACTRGTYWTHFP